MSSLWKSPLLSLPADGVTVFIRRLRFFDPPVLAKWDEASQTFITDGTATLTIIGGTYAGTHTVTFGTNWGGTGKSGWFKDMGGGIFIGSELYAGNWYLEETDLIANSYQSGFYAPPAGPASSSSFGTIGAPSWSGPTTMSLSALPPTIIIPAWGVNSWRPQ